MFTSRHASHPVNIRSKWYSTLFPPDSDFTVIPQYLKPSQYRADSTVGFEIQWNYAPVLILELRDPLDFIYISTRREADIQIRTRIGDLAERWPLRTLHAISALGTRLCFYSVDTTDLANAEILPLPIAPHPTRINNCAPAERWEYNIMEEGGEAKLRAVIQDVLQGCVTLREQEDAYQRMQIQPLGFTCRGYELLFRYPPMHL
jgi:hypothetical protein